MVPTSGASAASLVDAVATDTGRRLESAAAAAAADGHIVVVVPMTMGRDPALIAEAAKVLSWLRRKHADALVLAPPFGVTDHLTAHLRTAARSVHDADPDAALVIAAPASNPFDDAELHRVAHLVRVNGAGLEVLAVPGASAEQLSETARRLALLGFDRSVVVPAGFAEDPLRVVAGDPPEGMTSFGPLLGDGAVARIVAHRAADARHALSHGDDGIDVGLAADHGHGYAHSHGDDDGHHDHDHPHHDHGQHGHGHAHHDHAHHDDEHASLSA